MRLVYNSNSTMHLPVLMQIRVARETGWDGIFVRQEPVRRYLAQGYDPESLRDALQGLEPVNLGALPDVERWRAHERAAMLREAEALTELAVDIGASHVQLLTGPVTPGGSYSGPAELSPAELRRVTADGMRAVADLGAPHGIRYYLEPVAWTPLAPLARAVEAVDATERDSVGLVLDFWHLWQCGTTPDEVAGLEPRIIFGVDFADSLGPAGRPGPDQRSRCVWPGEGVIPLRAWVDAVRSTGFDGWWDNELYSPLHWESADPFAVGAGLLEVLRKLLRD
ncbi:MAG: sugar phosphate isomerase/epimerase [Chloroflexi bacterium]|nr:sugar phosphate isomerase/epimerase [Chloroflexota bacterium]